MLLLTCLGHADLPWSSALEGQIAVCISNNRKRGNSSCSLLYGLPSLFGNNRGYQKFCISYSGNQSFYVNREQRDQGPEGIQICLTSSLNCARIHAGMQQIQEGEGQPQITVTDNSPGAPGSQFIIRGESHPATECHCKPYSSFTSQNAVFGGGKWPQAFRWFAARGEFWAMCSALL